MMDHTDEYNTQARANPVFMTAKTAVCLMARAGIEDSVIIRNRLGLQDDTPLQSMADADVILGNVLVVEAKYRTMCRLIEDSGYHVCVDLPCGYTPKALRMTEKGLRFVGLDLPIVAQEAGPILRSLAACPELEYISSAGVRVLLSMQDNCKHDILFYNVSRPIAKILAQNGFREIC